MSLIFLPRMSTLVLLIMGSALSVSYLYMSPFTLMIVTRLELIFLSLSSGVMVAYRFPDYLVAMLAECGLVTPMELTKAYV